jgi:hypothetical protein
MRQLGELAALRSARSAARLAPHEARLRRLKSEADALRPVPAAPSVDLLEAVLRDRHARWREDALLRAMAALARAEAEAQPLREAQARDRAREAVLEKLAARVRRKRIR